MSNLHKICNYLKSPALILLLVTSFVPRISFYAQFPAVLTIDDLDGTRGFVVHGTSLNQFGQYFAGVGDLNSDEFDDVALINAAGTTRDYWVGVVSGGPNVAPNGIFDCTSRDGTNGLRIVTSATQYGVVSPGAAGDINHDGFADMSVWAGVACVIFGGHDVGAAGSIVADELDGPNGFKVHAL